VNGLVFVVAAILFLIWIWNSIYFIKEGERGVVLRLGKMTEEVLAPGPLLILWPRDSLYRVSVEPQTLTIPAQKLVAKGDVDIQVNAMCSFRVVDARRAISEVVDFRSALAELVAATMRPIVGQHSVDDVQYALEAISEEVKDSVAPAARDWGLEILSLELHSD